MIEIWVLRPPLFPIQQMSAPLRKPTTASIDINDDDDDTMMPPPPVEENGNPDNRQDQEEALVALIEHRTQEVEHNRRRLHYYQSKVIFHVTSFSIFKLEWCLLCLALLGF